MATDSVIAWFIVTVVFWWGLFRVFKGVVDREEARKHADWPDD